MVNAGDVILKATEARAAAAWVRLGVMLNVEPAKETPDVEHLLLDTAQLAGGNVRQFLLAATWLRRFTSYVAGHRLARLVRDELDDDSRPALGLMLEWSGGISLKYAIEVCRGSGSKHARPLSDAEEKLPILRRQAERAATPLSKKWRRWVSEEAMRMKEESIRPVAWVAKANPVLAARSTLGDVAASVVAEWPQGGEVEGVMEVSRRIGATQLATAGALRILELAGRVERVKSAGRGGVLVRILKGE